MRAIYLQQGSAPLSGGSYSSANTGSDVIYLNADISLNDQEWYIRVHATPGSTWQLTSGDLYVQDLAWDPGTSYAGTRAISQPSTAAGDYFFRITSQTSTYGTWRTALNVTAGEAGFYLQQTTVPLGDTTYESLNTGSGAVNYTLTSVGAMPIDDKTATPVAVGAVTSWLTQALPFGAQKVYRFRVPAGLTCVEVRFKSKVGNPIMGTRQDEAGSGKIPYPPYPSYRYKAHEEGVDPAWRNLGTNSQPTDVVTIASPVAGDYTITIGADYDYADSTTPDASYDLEVSTKVPQTLDLAGGTLSCYDIQHNPALCQGHLIDQQVYYYQVVVPDTLNGYAIAGWKINAVTTNGSATLRVARGEVPGGSTPSLATTAPVTVVAPPYLSPGTWYVEVKGNGITDYTISSDIISGEPGKNSRSWEMPNRNNKKSDGTTIFTYPAELLAPEIGDSGINADGSYVDNPNTHDQGIDLSENDWHFYRIVVPDNNAGHLKTIVEALSGKPELYIRAGAAPSPYHRNHATDPNYYLASIAFDRSQTVSGTMYGNWVPLDRRTELQLKPGDWWLGIKAVNSNIRYRLRVAAGNVRDVNGPVDSSNAQLKLFQDLNLSGGGYGGQALTAGNMRYYRVTLPQSSTTQSVSAPTNWSLTLTQQVGDVAVFIRDTIPPGQGSDGNAFGYPYNYDGSGYFQDWSDDNSNLNGNPYVTIDTPGTTTFTLPPLRPKSFYYVGVFARSDATFDLSSATGAEKLLVNDLIPFTSGVISSTLAAGESRTYRIDVPADALVWHHTSTHDGAIRFYTLHCHSLRFCRLGKAERAQQGRRQCRARQETAFAQPTVYKCSVYSRAEYTWRRGQSPPKTATTTLVPGVIAIRLCPRT